MPKSLLALLCVAVAAIQIAIFHAAQKSDQLAQHMQQVAQPCQGKVMKGEGEIIEGKSRYVVGYEFTVAGKSFHSEEYFSMRQQQVPQKGEAITVFFDPADPNNSTLTDPKVVVHRVATLKLLTLGFGAFTYSFIYVIWRNSSGSKKASS
ncbi:MAG: DUF3592 domain-containing protein [Candidatus Eremiobacteraeota bacterium]|nr:DUF3592 domain-containing protein [Candidatus Eremiobacteraeota bacterium]MCW5867817.1 DUF3592 domain-containing protein [Candidatus Eremiobacteraeota bacterium]